MQTKRVPYTFNRGGYYYFSRRVPSDLLSHYSYPRVVQGLRTMSAATAKTRALVAAAKLDEYWSHLRMTDPNLIGKQLLKVQPTQLEQSYSGAAVTLQEAVEVYLSAKGKNKSKAFKAAVDRAFRYLVEACGIKCLHEYTRADALKYRDYLVIKGLVGSSITRIFNTLRSVINFAIAELALNLKNPFVGLYHDRNAGVASERCVPLVGAAHWAAQRIMEEPSGDKFAFTRYNRGGLINGNSASAALNKWLKTFVDKGCTLHSLRHSMRDRLRAVDCPSDIIDQIGGWTREGVGEGYGEGHALGKMYLYMERL